MALERGAADVTLAEPDLRPCDVWRPLPAHVRLHRRRGLANIFGPVVPRFVGPLQWRPQHHPLMPRSFRRMVTAFVACNQLHQALPYLPLEIVWEILSHFWWRGTHREMLRCRVY